MLLKKLIFIVFLAFSLTFTIVLGCANEEPAERAGEQVEEGVEESGEAVEEGLEEGGEAVEDGAREAQQE
jgi:hypothetical protein